MQDVLFAGPAVREEREGSPEGAEEPFAGANWRSGGRSPIRRTVASKARSYMKTIAAQAALI